MDPFLNIPLLVIEDDSEDFILMQESLTHEHFVTTRFQLIRAKTLEEGLRCLQGKIFGAILLDLVLPDSRGFSSFEKIHAAAPSIPIILLTGLDDEDLARKALREGAQDYLLKNELTGTLLSKAIHYALERKKAEESIRFREEQLRQSQKMEAVGRLAGGVAHDFNNMLSAILGFSEYALKKIAEDHPVRRYLEEIRKAGQRSAALTRRLLTFSRPGTFQPQPVNMNDTIADMEKMLQSLIGESTELVLELQDSLSSVRTDPGHLEQALVNLVVNAHDAMPQGGRLRIKTKNIDIKKHDTIPNGSYVLLSIEDEGCGMSDEIKKRLFEPFFTTKEIGKGTGLGLPAVRDIVESSKGFITVDSAINNGTTFHLYFPKTIHKASETTTSPVPTVQEMPGTETVLLVEDEDAVRRMAQEALLSNGYTVLEARGGNEALQIIEKHQGPLHALLTDVIMPHMNGRDLAEKVRKRHPQVRVVYMSGYTNEASLQEIRSQKDTVFLQKPFPPQVLTAILRKALQDS